MNIFGTDDNDSLTGTDASDRIFGGQGNDTLIGLGGDDTLNGGSGQDRLIGGDGSDTFVVNARYNPVYDYGDQVIELDTDSGIDHVIGVNTGVDVRGTHVENISLTGRERYTNVYANDLDNRIQINMVSPEIGVYGFGGNDRIIMSRDYTANINGGEGNDTLISAGGDDYLDGGPGADVMSGGAGNDQYYVDDLGDRVIEAADGGVDRLYTRFSTNLPSALENLAFTGTDNLTGNGNAKDNVLTGNSGDNLLQGLAGDDTLRGNDGDDTLRGGEGDDSLYGLNGDDVLFGGAGADTLIGNNGADTLVGGSGDDVYIIAYQRDIVIERADGGNDTEYSNINHALSAHIETLRLNGENNPNGIGNGIANTLIGSYGDNTLIGRGGNDTLTGSGGDDTFVFDRALGADNIDTITDFVARDDQFILRSSVFAGLDVDNDRLRADNFALGTAASDADDRIVYDRATGNLYYDADGSGAGAQQLFAVLSNQNALAASDFDIL